MLVAPIQAVPIKIVSTGAVPPDEFYAIPVARVPNALLRDSRRLEQKITCCSWGPHTLQARPDTSPGQWYVFPVCRGQLVLVPIRVEAIQEEVRVPCR